MPSVRSVSCTNNLVSITDFSGVHQATDYILPVNAAPASVAPIGDTALGDLAGPPISAQTTTSAEDYLGDVWGAANITGYQIDVHVFSLSPLVSIVGTWEVGATIPANWWVD